MSLVIKIYSQRVVENTCFSSSVVIGYTSYQLVYGLHPLMPIEYIVPIASGDERDNTLMKVLTSRITKLKKLEEAKM
jgi:hypothetical protein